MNAYLPKPVGIIDIRYETAIDATFILAFEEPARFGQFVEVSLPGIGEAPISISMCKEGTIHLTIRKVGALTNALFEKQPGDVLWVRGPYGNGFIVEDYRGKDLIVIAGGTGLAPVRGLVNYYLAHPACVKSIQVIAGFRSPADMLFRDDLAAWAACGALVLTVDKADALWQGKTGLVTQYIGSVPTIASPQAHAIVVGPAVMMKFVTLELIKHKFAHEAITVSFERTMSCGLGKCGHCKIGETYVCVDGPVFSFAKARWLID